MQYIITQPVNISLPISVHNIQCASLNVCGRQIRVEYPDFTNLLQIYDLFLRLKQNWVGMMLSQNLIIRSLVSPDNSLFYANQVG